MKILEEYSKVITKLIDATENGKVNWKRQNPTTIFYESMTKSGEKALISIQSVGPKQLENYVFNVQNASKNEMIVSINTMPNRNFQGMLSKLYDRALYSIEQKSIDFLNDIISDFE